MRGVVLLAPLVLLAACGRAPEIPATDLSIQITPTEAEVEYGKAFGLEVVRIWSKDHEVRDFDEGALAPLVLRRVERRREEDARRVRETLRYRAYAFSLEDLEIRAPRLAGRPRAGGRKTIVEAVPLRYRVLPVVDPEAPGEPERLSTLYGEPRPRWILPGLLVAAFGILALLFRHVRRAPPPPPSPVDDPVLAELEAAGRDVAALSQVVRIDVGRLHGFDAWSRTRPEIVRRATHEPALLDEVLEAGERAKYAAWAFDTTEIDEVRAKAEHYVRATREAAP